jgi:hypothetical protein
MAAGLLVLWALLYLPNLRSNPNWYGDEGEWMDASWTLAQGIRASTRRSTTSCSLIRIRPICDQRNAPPRLRQRSRGRARARNGDRARNRGPPRLDREEAVDRRFGFLCAAAFLVYQAVINFRWARGHTLCGLFVTASIGFLVRYVQEKRLRDVLLPALMCSLAIATTYWSWSLVPAVVVTALFVNRKHAPAALLVSLGYLILFLVGYGLVHDGGFGHLKEQLARLYLLANGMNPSPFFEELGLDLRQHRDLPLRDVDRERMARSG